MSTKSKHQEGNNANTVLCDVFSLFCGHDSFRPELEFPFEINDKIYATCGHTLIRCDKSYLDFEVTERQGITPPNCEAVMPIPNISTVLNIDKSIFDQYKTEDELKYIGKDIDCETCDGHGVVDWEFEHWTKEFDCPKCDGSGYAAEKRSVKTGQKTFGTFRVKLNESYFKIDLFYKLIQVRDALGGEIELIHQSKPTSGVLFKVGFCEILLMPCPLYHVDDVDGVLNIT